MYEGFALERVDVGEVQLRVRYGGSGPPVLLLHGHPRTHVTWHKVAALLAPHHTVVAPDLRGYGESSKPPTEPDHMQASKRAMARDNLALMHLLGHERFAVVGHDRGTYVALRLALDFPEAVTHLAVLDGVPIADALARADAQFASLWWHWFFLAQPDKPERAINADPDAWYGNGPDKAAQMGEEAYADYLRAVHDPQTVHAMVEDYRAGLGVDREHDEADRAAGSLVACPTFVGWSNHDDLPTLYGDDLLRIWQRWAPDVRTGAGFSCGHHIAEEQPERLARELLWFLAEETPELGGLDLASVELDEIAYALDDHSDFTKFYFDTANGQVVPDSEDLGDDERDPRLVDEERALAPGEGELIWIQPRPSSVAYEVMEEFTDRILHERVQSRLRYALAGRGPFRRFRDAVEQTGVGEAWYEFRLHAELDAALEWLVDNNLVSVVAAERYRRAHPMRDLEDLAPRA